MSKLMPVLALMAAVLAASGCADRAVGPEASALQPQEDAALFPNGTPPSMTDDGVQVSTYFPLQDGSIWIYAMRGGEAGPPPEEVRMTVRITGTRLENGDRIACFSNYLFPICPSKVEFRNKCGNASEVSDAGTAVWYPWCAFGREPVEITIPDFATDCFHGSRGTCAALETVTVPAGTFERAAVLCYGDTPCADLGLVREVLAPHVGLIERRIVTFAGEVTWSLIYARVGNRVWGDPDAPPREPEDTVWDE